MRVLRKVRIFLSLTFFSLLFFGNPICVTFNCENRNDKLEFKVNQSASQLQKKLEECKPISIKCEEISFSAVIPIFVMNTPSMFISAPFAFFTIFAICQTALLYCGADSELNTSPMFWKLNYLDCLYFFEMFTYLLPILYALLSNIVIPYVDLASQYRENYFTAIEVIYIIGLFIYFAEVGCYLIYERGNGNTNRDQERNEQEA